MSHMDGHCKDIHALKEMESGMDPSLGNSTESFANSQTELEDPWAIVDIEDDSEKWAGM